MDKILFSKRLKERRKACGYSSALSFATAYNAKFRNGTSDLAGNNPNSGILGTLKNYENPKHSGMPRLDIVAEICELLDCDIDYLLGNIDQPQHIYQAMYQQCGLTQNSTAHLMDIYSLAFKKYWTINGVIGTADVPETEPIYVLNEYLENTDFLKLLLCYMLVEDMKESGGITPNERSTAMLLQINILLNNMKEQHNKKVSLSRSNAAKEGEQHGTH